MTTNNCAFIARSVCVIYSFFSLFLVGCAGTSTTVPHLLDNKIIDAASRKEVSELEVEKLVALADVVYLGEVHDNPWHHQVQLKLIQNMVDVGEKPAVGIEMFSNHQTSRLMSFVTDSASDSSQTARSKKSVRRLREQLGWGASRDQEWSMYFPLIDQAKHNGLPLFGIDLPAGIRQRITRTGLEGLTPVEKRLVTTTGFENRIYRKVMERQFTRSHCGWSDRSLLSRLYQTWVARNDAMATAISDMLSISENRPIFVILGAGHTKFNMGVYERVETLVPGVTQVNIGLTPTRDEMLLSEDYFDPTKVDNAGKQTAHELFWFTPPVRREDPCIKFKEQLKVHNSSRLDS